MQKRRLGRTGESLSVVGFGGVVVMNETPEAAGQHVAEAVRRGINYFDVAPSYGNAEERLGPALEPYRDTVFLACKTLERDREKAAAELRQSLRNLRTDRFDLYQFHAVNTMEEVEQITGPGGALEAVLEAREQGLVRFLGFSSHAEPAALAMLDRFAFDTVMFPFNWACWHDGSFGPRLLEKATKAGMGVLGLKALARRKLRDGEPRVRAKCRYAPVEDPEEAFLAMRFALSLPLTATVSPGEPELLWWACDAVERLASLTPDAAAALPLPGLVAEPLFGDV